MASSSSVPRSTAIISVRGVMTSATDILSNRMTLVTTFNSSSSRAPSLYPIWARIFRSVRLTVSSLGVRRTLLKELIGTRTGFISITIQWIRCAEGIASFFQYTAPIVLGTISEITRIASVKTPVKTPIHTSPKTFVAAEPPIAAPAV